MTDFSNVREFGIQGGTPCGAALNTLLHSGRSNCWFFPEGIYPIEQTLKIPSGTRLKLDPHAILRLADNAATTTVDYLLTNSDPLSGNVDISIVGGVFDGNQRGNPRPQGLFDPGYSGAMLHFQNVRGFQLSEVLLTNAEAYYARFTHVRDFTIENVRFDSDLIRPNNDGIHLGGNCSQGLIRHLRTLRPDVTGDDLVALNADDALQRTEVSGMTNGPIEDIVIEDLEAESCHTFVRLLSVWSPIRRVTIRNVRGGCNFAAINADGARGCRVMVFDEAHPPYPDGVGLLEDIQISGLRVAKRSTSGIGLIDLQERLSNVVITDFVRVQANDLAPDTPTVRLKNLILRSGSLNGSVLAGCDTSPPNSPFEKHLERIDELTLNPVSR